MDVLVILGAFTIMVLSIIWVFKSIYPECFPEKKKTIKKTKKEGTSYFFELVDYFYMCGKNNELPYNDLYLVLKNLEDNKLYCVYKEVYLRPDSIPYEKKTKINIYASEKTIWKNSKNKAFRKKLSLVHRKSFRDIKLHDSGVFWINKIVDSNYLIAIKNKKKLEKIYKGNINDCVDVKSYVDDNVTQKILLNANKNNDYNIIKDLIFIDAIVEFDE